MVADPRIHRQGGDVEAGIKVDLSTCVNPYGPPPAVVEALRIADISLIKRHPYEAAASVTNTYSKSLSVDADQLIATRGGSEALYHLATLMGSRITRLPLPAYTEYSRYFVGAESVAGTQPFHSVDQLAKAANGADCVVFSNPHNPTGRYLNRDQVLEVVRKNRGCLFVADESYADFLDDESEVTLVGTDLTNVVAVRSPTKFYGLGGVRIGVLWSANEGVIRAVRQLQTTWPVSALDAHLAGVALADGSWTAEARLRLKQDSLWLDAWLEATPGINRLAGPLHFRYVTGEVEPWAAHLRQGGVAVRVFAPAPGHSTPTARVAAPPVHLRQIVDVLR